MRIWQIVIKELKAFRDVRLLLFMLATPVLLILILGTALSGAFDETVQLKDIRIVYKVESSGSTLAAEWEAFARGAGEAGIRFEPAEPAADVLQEVRSGRYDGYALLSDSGIELHRNSRSLVESSIAEGVLAAFAERHRLTASLGGNAAELLADSPGSVLDVAIQAAHRPSAMDYYAVAMTTMIILYSAISASTLMDNERRSHTAVRLLASPVSKAEIFTGKIAGSFLLNALCVILIVLISIFMFNANWGDRLGLVFLVLFSQVLFALGLGLGVSYVIKEKAAGIVIVTFIQLEAFWGGAYFPTSELTGWLDAISRCSPLRWTNDALLQLIYGGQTGGVLPAILFNTGASVLLLTAAVILMRRREGL